jgi:hypothetical membrane protein
MAQAHQSFATLRSLSSRSNAVVRTFNARYPFLGPIFWIISLQYLIMQVVVASGWPNPPGYDWRANAISDLGNTACQPYSGRFVCSPQHVLMNISFIILGLTMVAGSWLIYHEFRRNRRSCYGFIGMAISGIGAVLVGAFPENVQGTFHAIGAFLAFGVGDSALILLAFTISMTKLMRSYTLISGIVGLIGLGLYASGMYWHLGLGGMERVAGYPQTFWLIVFGAYISKNHYQRLRHNRKGESL